MKYRVWYRPYDLPDEEDYFDTETDDEREARRIGAAFGYVTGLEII